MPGHLFKIITLFEKEAVTHLVVTKTNDKEVAREVYRRSQGSTSFIYKVLYAGEVVAVQG